MGRDAQAHGHAADPHHVRLREVDGRCPDQPANAMAGSADRSGAAILPGPPGVNPSSSVANQAFTAADGAGAIEEGGRVGPGRAGTRQQGTSIGCTAAGQIERGTCGKGILG